MESKELDHTKATNKGLPCWVAFTYQVIGVYPVILYMMPSRLEYPVIWDTKAKYKGIPRWTVYQVYRKWNTTEYGMPGLVTWYPKT